MKETGYIPYTPEPDYLDNLVKNIKVKFNQFRKINNAKCDQLDV